MHVFQSTQASATRLLNARKPSIQTMQGHACHVCIGNGRHVHEIPWVKGGVVPVMQADVPSLMDSEAVALQQPPLPPPPMQLTKDLQQQQDTNVGPRLDMQLGPQELPVIFPLTS